MKFRFAFAFLVLLALACQNDPSESTSGFSDKVSGSEIEIDKTPKPCAYLEKDFLRQEIEVIGDKSILSKPSAYDASRDHTDACYWIWTPDEDILGKEVDGYKQNNANGDILFRVLSNPGESKKFAQTHIKNQLGGGSAGMGGASMIMMKFEPVKGLGLEAIYCKDYSLVMWRVNQDYVFSLQFEYPLPEPDRKRILMNLARHITENL